MPRRLLIPLLAWAGLLGPFAAAQERDVLLTALSSNRGMRQAFAPLVEKARKSVVEITSGEDKRILGTIVGPRGWIVTKASELGEAPTCRLFGGQELPARTLHVDPAQDVAILQIQAANFVGLPLAEVDDFKAGQWLITVGPGEEPLNVGVVSVPPRRVGRRSGFLGVEIEDAGKRGARVTQVVPRSGAERAKVEVGDVILEVQSEAVQDRSDLIRKIGRLDPGTEILLRIRRGESTLQIRATLGTRPERTRFHRGRLRDGLYGSLSTRRDGFPRALQHDTVLQPEDCGSPVLDVRGRLVAINIARASRTSTLAIPSASLRSLIEALARKEARKRRKPQERSGRDDP